MGVDTGSAVDPIKCVRPAAKTATFNGGVVDAQNYRKVLFFQDVGVVAGTTPTLDGKIQASARPAEDTVLQTGIGATDAWVPLRNGAADNVQVAASWTTVGAITVYQVKVYLKRIGTIVTGKKIWATIEGDSTGDPDGTPVATSELVEAQDIGTDAEYVTFTFKTPADLGAATAYHLVFSGDYAASASNQVQVGVETVVSGGNIELYDAAWADVTTQTMEVQAYSLSFSDVSGATFTQVTDLGSEIETPQEIEVDTATYGPFLRYVGTIGGGGGESYTMAVTAVGGEKKVLP
jgi:hypothetical protein